MTKQRMLPTTKADALYAMGLMLPPHDVAPFSDAVRWVTTAYDAYSRCLGEIETVVHPQGCGLVSLYRVRRSRTKSAATSQELFG